MPMTVWTSVPLFRLRKIGDVLIVDIAEAVDSMNLNDLLRDVRETLTQRARPAKAVLFNLARVGFLQSTGWHRLLDFLEALSRTGAAVAVCAAPQPFSSIAAGRSFLKIVEEESAIVDDRRDTDTTAATRPKPPRQSTTKRDECTRATVVERTETPERSLFLDFLVHWPKLTLLTFVAIAATAVLLFVAGPSATEKQTTLCRQFAAEALELRGRKASNAEWNDLHQRAKTQLTPIIGELSKRGGSRSDNQTELLFAIRHLMEMISCPDCKDSAKLAADIEQRLRQID